MFFSNKLGLGFLRPFASLSLFFVLFSLASVQQAHAQIDIGIEVIGRTAAIGTPVTVSPNPVSSYAKAEHDPDVTVYSLTILDSNSEVLAVLDMSQSSYFTVSLPAGSTTWVFQTSAGVISEQLSISG